MYLRQKISEAVTEGDITLDEELYIDMKALYSWWLPVQDKYIQHTLKIVLITFLGVAETCKFVEECQIYEMAPCFHKVVPLS